MPKKPRKVRDAGKSPSSAREQWEEQFQKQFQRPWDDSSREQVLAAVRKRKDGQLLLEEIERVVVGVAALKRMLDGLPPPEEEPPPVFPTDRSRDERYLLIWAFEEGLVPFAKGDVSASALAVVSLLMGYESDAHKDGALERATDRMKSTRQRYRRKRPPTTPEDMRRLEQARALRGLEAPVRELLDLLERMFFEGTNHERESVPPGTRSPR